MQDTTVVRTASRRARLIDSADFWRLWFVGLVLMVGLVVVRPNPILLVIVVLGGLDLWNRWRQRGEAGEYYRLSVGQRVTVAVVYLGLVAALGLAMSATYVERTF